MDFDDDYYPQQYAHNEVESEFDHLTIEEFNNDARQSGGADATTTDLEKEFAELFKNAQQYRDKIMNTLGTRGGSSVRAWNKPYAPADNYGEQNADDYLGADNQRSNIMTVGGTTGTVYRSNLGNDQINKSGGCGEQESVFYKSMSGGNDYAIRDNTPDDERRIYARYRDEELMVRPVEEAYMQRSANDFTRYNDAPRRHDDEKRTQRYDEDDGVYKVLADDEVDYREVDMEDGDTQNWSLPTYSQDYSNPGNDQSAPGVDVDWEYQVGDKMGGAPKNTKKTTGKNQKKEQKKFNENYYELSSEDDYTNSRSAAVKEDKPKSTDKPKRAPNPVFMTFIEVANYMAKNPSYSQYKRKDIMKLAKIAIDKAKNTLKSTDPEVYGKKARELADKESASLIKEFEASK